MMEENRRLIAHVDEPGKVRQLWVNEINGTLEYEMIVNGLFLMATNNADTEALLVRQAVALADAHGGDILIGGLGMGYSVKEACINSSSLASIDVVELDPVVIDWNKTLIDCNREYLADSRVRIIQDDFIDYVKTTDKRYHAICMDIDNGPMLLAYEKNAAAYAPSFFARVLEVLHEGGVFAVWSGNRDDQLVCDMAEAFRGFSVEEAYQEIQGKRIAYYLFFGIK